MLEENLVMWRVALDVVVNSVSADDFREELVLLRESYGDDPDAIGAIYTAMLIEMFAESTGLFALALPPEEIPSALAEIRETLTRLDFEGEQARLGDDERGIVPQETTSLRGIVPQETTSLRGIVPQETTSLRGYYESFAHFAAPLFVQVGAVMETLLNCYAGGDYDPEANPNDLIAEALEIAAADLDGAQHLITQAGSIALHSRPLWWRWDKEAYGHAAPWLITVFNLVRDYTSSGQSLLGSPKEARASLQADAQMTQDAQSAMQEIEELMDETPEAPAPVDELIEELIEQEDASTTPEQLDLCRAHREEAILALVDLATDEDLQLEGAPGDGYAPIHAVELLGELKAAEAVPALIDIIATVDPLEVIYSVAIKGLENIGPPALEPLLDFMRYSWDVETKTILADAVANAGPDDERVYEALVKVWEEATWEEGKCMAAYALAQIGGERAIPLLEAGLEDPYLSEIDYGEIAYALEELGVEAPEGPAVPSPGSLPRHLEALYHSILSRTGDPAYLMRLVEDLPEEWRAHPDNLAHTYTSFTQHQLNRLITLQILSLPSEESMPLIAELLEATETLAFDGSTQDHPDWLRQTYDHIAECAGPDLQRHLTGVLLSLQHYLSDDYDIADEPDHLLAAARDAAPNDQERELRQLFGRAGALILHGRSFWRRWPAETDTPLSGWLRGLIEFRRPLERVGQIPLRPSAEIDFEELAAILAEVEEEEEKLSPQAAELLDVIIEQKGDNLPLKQRRRFIHRRAAIAPHLIRMVEDKRYWWDGGPGEGWAAILAVRLLGELKVAQAAGALVEVVADTQPDDIIYDAALFSLMNIGRLALPAVQAYLRYGRDVETKTALAEVLGHIGRRSSDSFSLLQEIWESAAWQQNRRVVALAFGDLRDRRAIPLLQTALKDRDADVLDLEYVGWALQRLGAPAPSLPRRSSRLKTPAPYEPRMIYDERDRAQRLRYNVWGEPLCPDCGKPLAQDEDGAWIHSP